MVLLRPDAAALADFNGHGAGDDVTRGEILCRGRVTLHEALAFGIDQVSALAARAFGDQHAGAVDAGRVKLHELHVFERQARAQHHGIAVTGLGVGAGARGISAAVAAGRQHRHLRRKTMEGAVVEVERNDAAAAAVVVHDQIDGEVFDEKLSRMPQRLTVHGVQHGVPGAVGGGAGALRDAFAVMGSHAAERALINLAVLAARERQAPMLELVHRLRRTAAHVFDGVLVTEPVGALDRVIHVPAPVVFAHVAERSRNAALRRDGVRAGRKHLGDARGAQAGLAATDDGAQAGAAGADNHDVVGVVLDRISAAVDGRCRAVTVGSVIRHAHNPNESLRRP